MSTAVVTGAAGGIGIEVVRRLMQRGHDLLLVDLDATALAQAHPDVPAHRRRDVDLTDAATRTALLQEVRDLPDLEVLVNAAGVVAPGSAADVSPAVIERQLTVNLVAALQLAAAGIAAMRPHGRGSVITVGSGASVVPLPGSAAYCASKSGVRAFTQALDLEARPHGITVAAVHPAAVDTPMLRAEMRAGGSPLNFIGRVLTPAEVADAIVDAIGTRQLEIFLPASDGVMGRTAQTMPRIFRRLVPLLSRYGERGARRYLDQLTAADQ